MSLCKLVLRIKKKSGLLSHLSTRIVKRSCLNFICDHFFKRTLEISCILQGISKVVLEIVLRTIK